MQTILVVVAASVTPGPFAAGPADTGRDNKDSTLRWEFLRFRAERGAKKRKRPST
jgi:hypothetical protein